MHHEEHEYLADSVSGSSDGFRVCGRPAAQTGPPLGNLCGARNREVSANGAANKPLRQAALLHNQIYPLHPRPRRAWHFFIGRQQFPIVQRNAGQAGEEIAIRMVRVDLLLLPRLRIRYIGQQIVKGFYDTAAFRGLKAPQVHTIHLGQPADSGRSVPGSSMNSSAIESGLPHGDNCHRVGFPSGPGNCDSAPMPPRESSCFP